MNPLFGNNLPKMLGPMQRMGQVMNDVRMLQQNPGQIGKYLADHGVINENQLSDINNMNPSQIGQYLMQNGIMSQQGVQQLSQMVPMIQNKM